ncbi:fimbrial protein [Erwinia sp. INIA-01]|uniref:fimbrial protein n=1 Tax=Erwinia sp. INIA01 TaxID=2991500 RepID=UPI00222566CA|nr:fimbrial protein [Erwinia sp. INIA01]MCW1877859.1 fimbrial protein [Erwinia sp. INIA01]
MLRVFVLLSLMCFCTSGFATCSNGTIVYGTPLSVDLSDKLSPATPTWTGNFTTQYSGSFTCTTRSSEFSYTPILSTDSSYATILGFSNNKYKVRAEITSTHPNRTLSGTGSHTATELNTSFTVRFTLVSQSGTTLTGDTATMSDVIFVSDMSGLSLLEIITWPIKQLVKILQWLLSGFQWPYDNRDMFAQPMTIKYAPKLTTCSLDNSGLTVKLPALGIPQLNAASQPGITPFSLNMSCQNVGVNGSSDRAIEMFLSSSQLLTTDNSVLIDSSRNAAQGVGLRIIQRSNPQVPITFSTSSTNRGNATLLFSVSAGGALKESFSFPMAVYYHIWAPAEVSQGQINASATLNIIYP